MRIIALLLCFLSLSTWGQSMKTMNQQEKIKYFYEKLSKNSMQLVDEFYHPQIDFIDPIHSLKGSDKMKKYYSDLYKNVDEIKFDFSNFVESDKQVVAIWSMTLKTEKLNGGEPFTVDGNSVIRFDDQGMAIYHRDYFDMGAFVYERVPVVGYIVKKIKARMKEE